MLPPLGAAVAGSGFPSEVARVAQKDSPGCWADFPSILVNFGDLAFSKSPEQGQRRNVPMGRMPTFRWGKCRVRLYAVRICREAAQHPLPLKGRKGAVQKERPSAKFAAQ